MGKKKSARGSGTIRQRPDGRWEARYTLGRDPGTGKQIQKSIYGKTQEEVRRKLSAVIKDIDDGTYADDGNMTIGRWMDIWIAEYNSNLKDSTRKSYEDIIRLHIKPGLGAVKLSKLTRLQIQRFYSGLYNNGRLAQGRKRDEVSGLSANTVRNIHMVLHKALRDAARPPHSLIKFNPAEYVTLPKAEKREMRALTDEEIVRLLEAMQGDWHYAIIFTALFCGLRRGEVLGLELDRYINSRGEGRIDVVYQLQREFKTGGQLRLVTLKNDRARSIYPCKEVFAVIDDWLEIREDMRKRADAAWKDSGLLFVGTTGQPLDDDAVYHAFKRVLKKAGISEEVRMHDLRHTYAMLTLASGTDVKTLQENLGHHDPGFTLRQYGHASKKMRTDAAARMDAYFNARIRTNENINVK